MKRELKARMGSSMEGLSISFRRCPDEEGTESFLLHYKFPSKTSVSEGVPMKRELKATANFTPREAAARVSEGVPMKRELKDCSSPSSGSPPEKFQKVSR